MHNFPHHKFHIPVMGLAYTIDSPVKVARFGIASVISIVEDRLIEMMRSHYYPTIHETYTPISTNEEDYRAKRITDYLNLVNRIVHEQVEKLKNSAFETGSEIVKYFEMLPDDSKIKQLYNHMMHTDNRLEKEDTASYLRKQIIPGSIDVNIMTKIDKNNFKPDGEVIEDGSDAVSALRGYLKSNLSNSSIIFSAGMNPRLYNYMEQSTEFDADEQGFFKKKVVIKVSDYRSALIQGKYLAKKGIWVSEFRIESGLNCGGHAFATDGYLMGPILEEFKVKKEELITAIFDIYNAAIKAKGQTGFDQPHALKITAQGGIGTAEEDAFLHSYYGVESTGWGTPFLVVPEATTVDQDTLTLLCKAKKEDVVLSNNSPLGVKFHYLKGTSADIEKQQRINRGRPGSPCTEKHLAFNTEFTTEPICTASHKYQQLKIASLKSLDLPKEEYQKQLSDVLDKECLCVGLSNSAAKLYDVPFLKKREAVNICPGPNIAYFSKVVTLQTMTDHIYGRTNIVEDVHRPHMFITELRLYVNHLKEQLDVDKEPDNKKKKYYQEFYRNLLNSINYYRELTGIAISNKQGFYEALDHSEMELNELYLRVN
ncbi:hypothetical protein LK994_01460 [Ferruginibacter lapsinanis]|uniref:hypothetical protein n=1 Tax=Ferruginibacter lapsinanis TaxID=563172 RepID=UPI001E2D44DA|nr:hypothetical protein [Ferruginibacter lapsinanis]UEG50142.1 hypothetical protein LK994_01460 [Ferruginibacter lapsinanis]